MELNPQDKDQWARSPGSQEFAQQLLRTIEETKERWSHGHFTGETAAETAALNNQAVAQIEMLRQVVDMIEDWKIVAVPAINEEESNDD